MILIEHMEEYPSRWLIAEYIEALEEARRAGHELLVTGVRDPRLQSLLNRYRVPWSWEHSWELYDTPKTIVLDLWAGQDLQPDEAVAAEAFVIGGIMGDHPPRMRGYLLTSRFNWAARRRLGPKQMSIHVATWAVIQVGEGKMLGELEFCDENTLRVDTGLHEVQIELPFAYPCDDRGKPRIPERIIRLLENGVLWDEEINIV